MNILVYQDISFRHIKKANVINTINIARGFLRNNYTVHYFLNNKKAFEYFNDKISNVVFVNKDEIIKNIDDYYCIYCRGIEFPLELIKMNYKGNIIIESHDIELPENIDIIRKCDNIIFTSISNLIIQKYEIKKSLLFPCSIDFELFSEKNNYKNNIFEKKLFNITYCGHLYDYKGIPLIINCAKILKDYCFNIVGGNDSDIERHKKNSPENVIYHGFVNYNDVPNYLYSSDLLIIPYSKNGIKFSPSNITSPIKLFEYLSTKKPVLCSNIEGIVNWVNNDEVFFYEADNIVDFCDKINYIKNNIGSKEVLDKIENGFVKSSYYTTKNKCKKLIELCN